MTQELIDLEEELKSVKEEETLIEKEIRREQESESLPSSVLALYEMPWKEYLDRKNYNKDLSKMCDLCRKQQIKDYGKITIECNGLKEFKKDSIKEYLHIFTEQELNILEAMHSPVKWANDNIDIEKIGLDSRYYKERWYQNQFISCSARSKVIRCGRRTGKTYGICVDIVHRCLNNDNYRVLAVSAKMSQIIEIFTYIKNIIRKLSPDAGNWDTLVERSAASPYYVIEFKNGSIIKGFTSGNDDAEAVRGQGADLILLDEVDFISTQAFDNVSSIRLDTPETEIITTSTPYGERTLYRLGKDPEYKEFHFPSLVLPHYDDKMHRDSKKKRPLAYVQEILAEYGVADDSVFYLDFIKAAEQKDAPVEIADVLANRNDYILILGCDWNADKVGTRICILAYHKEANQFFVAKLDNVKKDGWTQTQAIEKIVQLNRIYIPDHIYVDEGFGESNVQHLKLIAVEGYGKLPIDHPDLRLDEVVAVNFGSSMELKDVITGDIRKKNAKNFAVEQTRRLLEQGNLSLKGIHGSPIAEQMKNYTVANVTPSGREVYAAKDKDIGDHDLDAFMFAVFGFAIEYDSILDKTEYSNITIAFVGKTNSIGYNENTEIEGRISTSELFATRGKIFHSYKNIKPASSRSDFLDDSSTGLFGSMGSQYGSYTSSRGRSSGRGRSSIVKRRTW